MKHATPPALAELKALIGDLRKLPGVTERRPAIFYAKGKALLHFHEDPDGLFADIKGNEDWERFAVNTVRERTAFLKRASKAVGGKA